MTGPLLERVPGQVREVADRLRGAGFSTWVVGGSIRDLLLGREGHDWDLATSARPDQVKGVFRKVIPTGEKHGTVTVLHRGEALEVTTLRGEGAYSDGRRPDSVHFVDDIVEDLSRRDLTINAMALDLVSGNLIDPFGGRQDLAAQVVRAVGDATARFTEDGLRPLRAVRFATTLGFSLDPETARAIPAAIPTFRRVSAERIRNETWRILTSDAPSRGLRLLGETELLAEVLPELGERPEVFEHTLRVVDAMPPRPAMRLAAVFHDLAADPRGAAELARARLDALRAASRERDRVVHLVACQGIDPAAPWGGGELRRLLRAVGPEALDDALLLRRVHFLESSNPEECVRAFDELASRLRAERAAGVPLGRPDLAVDGRTLMARLGIPPGPRVGEILDALLERVLDDPSANDEERLLNLASELATAPRE